MGRRRLQRRGDNVRQPISFLSPNRLFLCAVLSWFRSFLWVFRGFPLCFRCFLTVFCGFRCMQGNQSRSFIPIPLFQWNFPLFFTVFRSFFWVFWGISSCFGCYPVCSRCFLRDFDVFRSRLLPPIAQTARCGFQKPRDIANPFTNTPRFGPLTLWGEPTSTPLFSTNFGFIAL